MITCSARGTTLRRRIYVLVALGVGFSLSAVGLIGARADTGTKLDAARHELERINDEVDAQLAQLADLRTESNALAGETSAAEERLDQAQASLDATHARIAIAETEYATLNAVLQERAAQMFMSGPGTTLEFVLGASSMADLSDRIQFAAAVTDIDVQLANDVENLRAQLEVERAAQARAVDERATAFDALQSQLAELQDRFDAEQAIYDSIVDGRVEAEAIVADLRQQYQNELDAMIPAAPPTTTGGGGSSGPVGSNPFSNCPVGQPHALTDSFGAPRYGGGYHLHAGNDIMASEGVPIYATFDGTASNVSNSLGGLAVKVVGAQGWTYNAHMVRIGKLGSVQAGDVIGYVGATGDTSTPHNHFEWHPNVTPSSWPASPYGYAVVGDAVNPYPILVQVC